MINLVRYLGTFVGAFMYRRIDYIIAISTIGMTFFR